MSQVTPAGEAASHAETLHSQEEAPRLHDELLAVPWGGTLTALAAAPLDSTSVTGRCEGSSACGSVIVHDDAMAAAPEEGSIVGRASLRRLSSSSSSIVSAPGYQSQWPAATSIQLHPVATSLQQHGLPLPTALHSQLGPILEGQQGLTEDSSEHCASNRSSDMRRYLGRIWDVLGQVLLLATLVVDSTAVAVSTSRLSEPYGAPPLRCSSSCGVTPLTTLHWSGSDAKRLQRYPVGPRPHLHLRLPPGHGARAARAQWLVQALYELVCAGARTLGLERAASGEQSTNLYFV